MVTLAVLLSGFALANPPSSNWIDANGNVIEDEKVLDALDVCRVDVIASQIANFKEGDLKALIDEYEAAVECFKAYGFQNAAAE